MALASSRFLVPQQSGEEAVKTFTPNHCGGDLDEAQPRPGPHGHRVDRSPVRPQCRRRDRPGLRSCDALTAKWPNGVAKGLVATNKAVRDGNSRPATTKLAVQVYRTNYRSLDRDKDGTACEN